MSLATLQRARDVHRTGDLLTQQQAEEGLAKLALNFGIPKPRLSWTNQAKNGRAWNIHNRIALGPRCWRGTTNSLLHEFAHILSWQRQRQALRAAGFATPNVVFGHGRHFIDTLIDVVEFWFQGDLSKYGWFSEYRSIARFASKMFATGNSKSPTQPTRGVTKQVWEIADSLIIKGVRSTSMAAGRMAPRDIPPARPDVIAACVAACINPSTASTQYGKWRKARGY